VLVQLTGITYISASTYHTETNGEQSDFVDAQCKVPQNSVKCFVMRQIFDWKCGICALVEWKNAIKKSTKKSKNECQNFLHYIHQRRWCYSFLYVGLFVFCFGLMSICEQDYSKSCGPWNLVGGRGLPYATFIFEKLLYDMHSELQQMLGPYYGHKLTYRPDTIECSIVVVHFCTCCLIPSTCTTCYDEGNVML